mmetsp:Transcript_69539/g.77791  ORF Transcript_69539/g.77791 Transcript_69539/m.77791 type:complete len:440 (-) Transcript_69539:139-1458(-)
MKLAILLATASLITKAIAFAPFHKYASKSTIVLSVAKDTLYEESMPMLYASLLAYDFAEVVKAAREREITLKLPADFPVDLNKFQDESLDFTKVDMNNGNGLCFSDIMAVIESNKDIFTELLLDVGDDVINFNLEVLNNIAKSYNENKACLYLSVYRSYYAKVSCVYGIVKDVNKKRIIVAFRGSKSPGTNQDWQANLNSRLVKMETPALIQNKLDGDLKKHIYVHDGFHDYLFENNNLANVQVYDNIVNDIKPLMEKDYTIYVTGHSLGGSLAHLLSFTLAGKDIDWLPKPITCISYAAPYSGGSDYRTANEQLEKDDLLRSLRIFNENDFIPVFPPISLNFLPKPMKHTGINLRLTEENGYTIGHSSNDGFWNAVNNSFVKLFKKRLFEHGPQAHGDRLVDNKKELNAVTIDGLYKDKTVVSNDFIEGKTKSSNNKS